MKTEQFVAGVRIFAQGDYSEEAYRIVDGSVEISINEGRSKVILATLGVGEVFGEILVPYLTTIFDRLRVTNERLRTAHERLDTLRNPALDAKVTSGGPVVVNAGNLLIEPDSDETRRQSGLKKQTLTSFPFILGRRADLAACVDVFSKIRLLIGDRMPFRVSRSHCAIEHVKGAYFIQDRGSKLGSIVNGIPIGAAAKDDRVRLRTGRNTLVLGPANSEIRFILTVPDLSSSRPEADSWTSVAQSA
jgi:pSer/pThr/pTyr-binding forkhead associated (FHA) protein